MLSSDHPARNELIELKENINSKIHRLKTANKDIDVLLNQNVLIKDDNLMKYIDNIVDNSRYLLGCLNDYEIYKLIETNHPPKAFTKERTYKRDLCLSVFHRSIDSSCFVTDLDFLEFRKKDGENVPVLLYDAKRNLNLDAFIKYRESYLTSIKIYLMVARALKIPFWIVSYKPPEMDITIYLINSISPDGNLEYNQTNLTSKQFQHMIESLKPNQSV